MKTLTLTILAFAAVLATTATADASRGCVNGCCGWSMNGWSMNGIKSQGIKLQGRSSAAVAAVDAGALRVRAIRLPGGRSSI